jgi:threonine synthase
MKKVNASSLVCPNCGWKTDINNTYYCDECHYSLEVNYNYANIDKNTMIKALSKSSGVWDYNMILPIRNEHNIISLNEGNTPLLQSLHIGKKIGINLLFKDETRNPSSSFKDRPNTVAISMAKDLGIDTVTIASTGNAGSSMASYAARSSMRSFIFVPESTPLAKTFQASIHGATIIKVKGNYSDSYKIAQEVTQKYNWANLTSTYLNPYTLEGDKTIAYELYNQIGGFPNWIVVPLGAGALLSGIYKGFKELKLLGITDEPLPHMLGVQAEGCSPIIKAFIEQKSEVQHFINPSTIADGICDPLIGYAQDGTRTLRTIYESLGAGISVSDDSILNSLCELAEKEAIFCEPSSATVLSAIYTGLNKGIIKKGETVVAIITGHGLKAVEEMNKLFVNDINTIEPNIDQFNSLIKNNFN